MSHVQVPNIQRYAILLHIKCNITFVEMNLLPFSIVPLGYLPSTPHNWTHSGSPCPVIGNAFCLNGGTCVFFKDVGEPACKWVSHRHSTIYIILVKAFISPKLAFSKIQLKRAKSWIEKPTDNRFWSKTRLRILWLSPDRRQKSIEKPNINSACVCFFFLLSIFRCPDGFLGNRCETKNPTNLHSSTYSKKEQQQCGDNKFYGSYYC